MTYPDISPYVLEPTTHVCLFANGHAESFGNTLMQLTNPSVYDNSYWTKQVLLNTAFGGTLAAICLVVLILLLSKKLGFIKYIKRISLKIFFFIALTTGFFVYDIGMCTGEPISLILNAPMALLHALGMFILESDSGEIHEPFYYNWTFMFFFSMAHFLAAIVSMLFIIKHFGFNIVAKYRIWKAGWKSNSKRTTYVLWNTNTPSFNLAESIKEHHSRIGDMDYRIIMVRTNPEGTQNPSGSIGIDRILEFLSAGDDDIDKIENLKILTTSTYVNLKSLNINNYEGKANDILGKTLRLKPLKKIISNNSKGKTHMFFLSDDEEENINGVTLLKNDMTLNEIANNHHNPGDEPDIKVTFHFRARHNGIHSIVENIDAKPGMQMKAVDPSHISVEMLKHNEITLPVNFVKVEADATVSSRFRALVIGFNATGQDAVRFLYEFGAFIKTGSTDGHAFRSDFHIDAVDKDMDELAGEFAVNVPAIRPHMPFAKCSGNQEALITLHDMDCRGVEFNMALEQWIKELNYIVVATEDDELNMSLGVRIFKAAARYRADMSDLCILVRTQDDKNGQYSRIANHFNMLWKAQEETEGDNPGKDFHQKKVRRNERASLPIHLFGQDNRIYTFANIVDDTYEKKAMEFKERYERSANPAYCETGETNAWMREYHDKMHLTEEHRDYHPSYCGLMGLRRTQAQDLSNSLHAQTKRTLARRALAAAGLQGFDWSALGRKYKSLHYTLSNGDECEPAVQKILRTLAQTEHIRWNSSHELLGYVREGEPGHRDEVKMQHGCITEWHNLSEELQSYDCNVVDVTLGIINPDNPIENQ